MAKYETSFKITFDHEGGYVNHPNDKGGETIFGISRRYHPNWAGWTTVDLTKQFCSEKEGTKEFDRELTNHLKGNQEIERQKREFYKSGFWDKLSLDKVDDQRVANALFDAAVNHDPRDAAKMAQRCLDVKVDGIIGSKTIEALNSQDPSKFLRAFTKNRIQHYKDLVKKDSSQAIFLGGWMKRAESFNV